MRKPVTMMVIAVVLAVSAGLLVFSYSRATQADAAAAEVAEDVLVSTAPIAVGTSLGDARDRGLIEPQTIPARLAPSTSLGVIDSSNEALIAQSAIPAGQVLLAGSFGPELAQVTALDIPEGLMAMTVQLEDPAKVGSFLRPGSEISVFNTMEIPGTTTGQPNGRFTTMLIDRVQVLAIGPVTTQASSSASEDAWNQQLVTLAVTARQAELLVHGVRTGSLYLSLLSESSETRVGSAVTDSTVIAPSSATR